MLPLALALLPRVLPFAGDRELGHVLPQLLLAPLALGGREAHQLELDGQLRLAVPAPLTLAPLGLQLGRTLTLFLAPLAGLAPPAMARWRSARWIGRWRVCQGCEAPCGAGACRLRAV